MAGQVSINGDHSELFPFLRYLRRTIHRSTSPENREKSAHLRHRRVFAGFILKASSRKACAGDPSGVRARFFVTPIR
jgi:hypothetical protein